MAIGLGVALVFAALAVDCSLLPLTDLDPGWDVAVDGPDVFGIAFISEIILCRFAKTSPPPILLCFFEAASTAASIAVRGADTGA